MNQPTAGEALAGAIGFLLERAAHHWAEGDERAALHLVRGAWNVVGPHTFVDGRVPYLERGAHQEGAGDP